MMDNVKSGLYIAELRKQLRITQRELADMLGVTNRTVSKWETGAGMPDIGVLPALAEVLGTSVDCILSGADGAQEEPLPLSAELEEAESEDAGQRARQRKLAEYMLDRKVMGFRITGIITLLGGVMSVLVMFVLLTFLPRMIAVSAALVLDGVSFVAFLVFFYQMQYEADSFNKTFSADFHFKSVWRRYAVAGLWIWTIVPMSVLMCAVFTYIFPFNSIAFGILWVITYISVVVPVMEAQF